MDNAEISNHISKQFNQDLERVRGKVLTMGGLVEEQIVEALKALRDADGSLGEQVIKSDIRINALEVEIDEECTRIIARRQPTAMDLRMIVTIIKTITDLERIGDEAEKIGHLAVHLSEMKGPAYRHASGIEHIGELVRVMLRDVLDAFVRLDVDAAVEITHRDFSVDREYESLLRQLMTYMMEDPRSISSVLDVMWAARALERIGDHAKNIGEYVVYLVKGKDIRHISPDAIAAEILDD
ncbi:MAG: phosphate signaling complex protein PhoU [Gammaproteobacteria bacterium]